MNEMHSEDTGNVIEQVEEMAQELMRRLDLLNDNKSSKDISYGQYKILSVINGHGSISVGKLGRLVGSAQSTTSEMIARLTKSDMVKKVRGPYDGRVVVVELTEKGKILLRRRRTRVRESYGEFFNQLDPAERENFVTSLKNMDEILKKLNLDDA